jgi:F0F1-type ATP synthase assembly protein I
MTISSLPWFIMFILILSAGAITMAIKPLETNLDCPLRKILSEIAPADKIKINMINQGKYHVEFKDMTISSLPWFIMFILILSAGAISDKILRSGQSRPN